VRAAAWAMAAAGTAVADKVAAKAKVAPVVAVRVAAEADLVGAAMEVDKVDKVEREEVALVG